MISYFSSETATVIFFIPRDINYWSLKMHIELFVLCINFFPVIAVEWILDSCAIVCLF